MNNTKKKSSAGLKACIAVMAVVDIFLLAGIIMVVFSGGISGGGGTSLSDTFVANADEYFENLGEEITPEEDTIAIQKSDASQGLTTETPKPSSTPGGVNEASADANGFLFPESSTKAITDEEMTAKLTDNNACRHAINEIYARHGYQFTNAEIFAYFNQFDWYKNLTKETDMSKVDVKFSVIEKQNVEKIQKYKASKGWG